MKRKNKPLNLQSEEFKKELEEYFKYIWQLSPHNLDRLKREVDMFIKYKLEKRVKSAVQGLLEDIDKKLIQREKKLIKSEYEEGFVDGYKCACYEIIKKIKKWSPDVVEAK